MPTFLLSVVSEKRGKLWSTMCRPTPFSSEGSDFKSELTVILVQPTVCKWTTRNNCPQKRQKNHRRVSTVPYQLRVKGWRQEKEGRREELPKTKIISTSFKSVFLRLLGKQSITKTPPSPSSLVSFMYIYNLY